MNFDRLTEIAYSLHDHTHYHRCFHTTFILRKSKILSMGVNSGKTNAKNVRFSFMRRDGIPSGMLSGSHSELAALVKLGNVDCSDCTFVNLRIDRNNKLNNSRFCKQCSKMLTAVGYRKAYYTDENGQFQEFE